MQITGLTNFQKDLLKTSKAVPKEMPKIMRKVGTKARSVVAKRARSDVKKLTGNYHKSWKRGKVFIGNEGAMVVRVYNSSPHAHLIEDGHRQVTKDGQEVGFVRGKRVLEKGMVEFDSSGVAGDMISDWVDELLEQNKL
ncbi:HK97 gp10 family phage protein [Lysinibacillus pakistanensis]|uniref:HK97 gp10 family phage protein n=1 Tax=Lysinibacillus pakistanensis TaxID=759811 RepID=UPI003D2C34A0